MKDFFLKHKGVLSISLSVVASVLLVALVVSAATTIGANIVTAGNTTLGDTSGDTVTVNGSVNSNVLPEANNTRSLGAFGTAWANVYASGTVFSGNMISSDFLAVGNGSSTSTIRGGASVTSTFTSGVQIAEASATSTLSIGGTVGSCLDMVASDGSSHLYILVKATDTVQMVTSTTVTDCY